MGRADTTPALNLLRQQAYVNGQWTNGSSDERLDVANPSTGSVLGSVPCLSASDTRRAIERAERALPSWRSLGAQARAQSLNRWHDLILEQKKDLAHVLTLEQGKPSSDALGEIDYGASFVEWFAEEGKRTYGETIPSQSGRRLLTIRQPIGVAALVTPWNFPHAMLTRKAAAALAAGCTVVAYQSMETPFSSLALAALAEQAGIPKGVFNVLTGDPLTVVGEFCVNPAVRQLSFTGSTEVGRVLLQQSAETVKRTCMELGGHAPFIGFSDIDVDALVQAAVGAKFQTSGQDCLAANRIYIHRDIYEPFLPAFSAAAAALVVGDGFSKGVQIGPLQNEAQVVKCEEHIADAVSKGARLVVGGQRHELGGLFFQPTVLADVTSDMRIYREETFGPVAAVMSFDSESAVIDAANDSEFGLAAYVYTHDMSRCLRMSDALEYGLVGVNSVKITGAPIPFGGMKQSGIGKEGSRYGIEEFCELKYVCMSESA